MALDEEIAATDALIERRFRDHPYAEIILSMPGLGPVLGAEFIAHTGGVLRWWGTGPVRGWGVFPTGRGGLLRFAGVCRCRWPIAGPRF